MADAMPAGVPEPRDRLRVVVAGEVDHGKSTLIAALGRVLRGQSLAGAELAHDLDHLVEERQGGFTWEATELLVEAGGRQWVFADVPGHRQWLANMLSGAGRADAALLILAADGEAAAGTARHAALLALLGPSPVLGVITRLDLVADPAAAFARQAAKLRQVAAAAGLPLELIVPVAAPKGWNLAAPAEDWPWYQGPALLECLADCQPTPPDTHGPACLEIQGLAAGVGAAAGEVAAAGLAPVAGREGVAATGNHRSYGSYRTYEPATPAPPAAAPAPPPTATPPTLASGPAGPQPCFTHLWRGQLHPGDTLRRWPTGEPWRVAAITRWPAAGRPALAGEYPTLLLQGPALAAPLARGQWLLAPDCPWQAAHLSLTLRVYWLGEAPLRVGDGLALRVGFQECLATVMALAPWAASERQPPATDADTPMALTADDQALVTLSLASPLCLLPGLPPAATRVLLLQAGQLVGLGTPGESHAPAK